MRVGKEQLTEQGRAEAGKGRAERRERKDPSLDRFYFYLFKASRSTTSPFIVSLPTTMAPVAASPTPIVDPLPAVTPITAPKDKKAAARKRFEAVYTIVRDDLLADFRKHNMPEEAIDYYRRVRTPHYMYSSYAMFSITR
jgi:hypothetical protein